MRWMENVVNAVLWNLIVGMKPPALHTFLPEEMLFCRPAAPTP